jgi:hypothetical protein
MIGKIHPEIATHQDDGRDDNRSANETEACRDVHGEASATHYARAAHGSASRNLAGAA